MTRGIVIGRFKASRQGGWEGEIQTLTIDRQLRLVPNDDRANANAPAFRVMMGWQQIGDAWERQSRTEPLRHYLRVQIDDPVCSISAMLFTDPDDITARLVLPLRQSGPVVHAGRERGDD